MPPRYPYPEKQQIFLESWHFIRLVEWFRFALLFQNRIAWNENSFDVTVLGFCCWCNVTEFPNYKVHLNANEDVNQNIQREDRVVLWVNENAYLQRSREIIDEIEYFVRLIWFTVFWQYYEWFTSSFALKCTSYFGNSVTLH